MYILGESWIILITFFLRYRNQKYLTFFSSTKLFSALIRWLISSSYLEVEKKEISKNLNKQIYMQGTHKTNELQNLCEWMSGLGQSVSSKLLPHAPWWLEQNLGRGFIGWIRILLAIVQIMNHLEESQLSQKDRLQPALLHLTLGLQILSGFEEGRGDTRTHVACFGKGKVELCSSKAGNLCMMFSQGSTPTFSVWKTVVQNGQ